MPCCISCPALPLAVRGVTIEIGKPQFRQKRASDANGVSQCAQFILFTFQLPVRQPNCQFVILSEAKDLVVACTVHSIHLTFESSPILLTLSISKIWKYA